MLRQGKSEMARQGTVRLGKADGAERCWSGRTGTTGNRVCLKGHQGFESLPLRHSLCGRGGVFISTRVSFGCQAAGAARARDLALSWKNDPNLSGMSDNDYLRELAESLTAALHDAPYDARTWFLRGNAYLDGGALAAAIGDYDRALELAPRDAVAHNNRGIAYRNMGETDRAIADYERAIEIDPGYRDAYNNLGMARADKREYEVAIGHFSRAIELDGAYWYAYNNRGMALWAVGRREEAVRDYERAKGLATG